MTDQQPNDQPAMCFMSYSRNKITDRPPKFVKELKQDVERYFQGHFGYPCSIWLDHVELDIALTHEDTVESAIAHRPIFIPIVCYDWLDGEYSQWEYQLFMKYHNGRNLVQPPSAKTAAIIAINMIGTKPHEWARPGHPAAKALAGVSPYDFREAWRSGRHTAPWNAALTEISKSIDNSHKRISPTAASSPSKRGSQPRPSAEATPIVGASSARNSEPSTRLQRPVLTVPTSDERSAGNLDWLNQVTPQLSREIPSHVWLVDELEHRIATGESDSQTKAWFLAMLKDMGVRID